VKSLLFGAAFLNTIYLIWLPWNIQGVAGFFLFFAEFGLSSLIILFSINNWQTRSCRAIISQEKPAVDVFITVVDEPLPLFESTLSSIARIEYGNKHIYALDDGARPEIEILSRKYGAKHIVRSNRPQNYKAGNLNYGLSQSSSPFILTLDADQKVTNPKILNDLIGYFEDPKVALVSTHQSFSVPLNDFNHDTMFYQWMQPGKEFSNAAISVGSGSIYRRSAIEKVGGFPTWSVIEDMYVSYLFHRHGYTSHYIDIPYTIGTAPARLPDIAKQRGTWALDSMRMLIQDCPLFKRELTWRQRLQYFEIGYIYLVSALCLPILFLMPSIAAWWELSPVKNPEIYILLRGPSLVLAIYTYYLLHGKSFSASQYWSSLSFVYLKSFLLSLRRKKPKYTVTAKIPGKDLGWELTIPHLFILLIAFATAGYKFYTLGFQPNLIAQLFWAVLTLFWFYPWILRGWVPSYTKLI